MSTSPGLVFNVFTNNFDYAGVGGGGPSTITFNTDINSPSIFTTIENIIGGSNSNNTVNGIQIDGSSGGNTTKILLTNRITGSGTTTDDSTPITLFTFPLGAVPGVYQFSINVAGFNKTDSIGAGYSSTRTMRTDGSAGTLIDALITSIGEEGTMSGVLVENSITSNNYILKVTGLASKTIDWIALTTFIFVS